MPHVFAVGAAVLALSAPPPLPRATQDRPDDTAGSQVHLVYALPSDGADRALDTDATIAGTVAVWEAWLAGQTGGDMLRLDTFQGGDDITFVRLGETDAEIAARGAFVRDQIEADLKARGLIVAGKIYAVYYDGSSTFACGGGAWPPTLPGSVAALYLRGAPPGAPACDTNRFGVPGSAPGYLDFAMIHELMHTLGFVPPCAPHHTLAGHVSDSNTDLMYAGSQPWAPSTLDVGHDDYFKAHTSGCIDLADSPFFASHAPPAAAAVKVSLAVLPARSGTVTGLGRAPCRATCTASIAVGQRLTLRARPAPKRRFAGWSGACTGRGLCVVDPTADVTVGARFPRR